MGPSAQVIKTGRDSLKDRLAQGENSSPNCHKSRTYLYVLLLELLREFFGNSHPSLKEMCVDVGRTLTLSQVFKIWPTSRTCSVVHTLVCLLLCVVNPPPAAAQHCLLPVLPLTTNVCSSLFDSEVPSAASLTYFCKGLLAAVPNGARTKSF